MDIINKELARISEWFRANRLSLNVKKTNFMLFGKRGKKINESSLDITVNGEKINRVSETKFLGVYIDDELNWKYHTSQIASKISKNLGVLFRIKDTVPKILLKTLYFTMIHPYLNYCNIIWGGTSKTTLNKLIHLQKRAVRLITKSKYRAPTSDLFKQLQILKLEDIHRYQQIVFIYKLQNKLLPLSCMHHIKVQINAHQYNLRGGSNLSKFTFASKIREKYIGVNGPSSWNGLSDELKKIFTVLTI